MFHTLFALSTGLSRTIRVRPGLRQQILDHVARVESVLKLEREQYRDNPPHWSMRSKDFSEVDDKTLCAEVELHNSFVRAVYRQFSEPPKRGAQAEKITPAQAREFWHGLEILHVAPERWTRDFYVSRMEFVYEGLRGRPSEEFEIGKVPPLTPEQCDTVINLFAQWLDKGDCRVAVPVGCDHIATSDDGGYDWCSTCGAVDESDFHDKCASCPVKGCDLRSNFDKNGDLR